jgi:putative transposase
MALDDSALLEMIEVLRSADGGELMRRLLGGMLQAVVDAEATAHIGAGLHERSDARTTQRNGTRDKTVTTTAGDLTVKIPKVRTGSFFPALLNPRRRIDVALHAVVMQAYVEGVSTRRVDDLVVALGGTGISKSECPGSAPSSTPRSRPGGLGRWTSRRSPTSSSTPPTARSGSTSGWCPRRW